MSVCWLQKNWERQGTQTFRFSFPPEVGTAYFISSDVYFLETVLQLTLKIRGIKDWCLELCLLWLTGLPDFKTERGLPSPFCRSCLAPKTNTDRMAAAANLNPGFHVKPVRDVPDTILLFLHIPKPHWEQIFRLTEECRPEHRLIILF